MPEEQLYLALYIEVMKFKMEISKLQVVNMFIRYIPPKDGHYPACDKGLFSVSSSHTVEIM